MYSRCTGLCLLETQHRGWFCIHAAIWRFGACVFPPATQFALASRPIDPWIYSPPSEKITVFYNILATTLGETGGDALSMSMHLGYAISSAIFIGLFLVAVAAQITVKSFHPFLYWAVIVATTTAGTTMADFADRSLGIGYAGGASILFVLLIAALGVWYLAAGSISIDTITSPKVEMFYWLAILFSQTLGTALGDWMADTTGLGYQGGALVFAAGLVLVAVAISTRTSGAPSCSGRPSSSRDRSVPRWAICWTSHIPTGASR